MDKVGILCGKDSELMHEFSRRSIQGLHEPSLLTAALSFFPAYLEKNVKKETDKDRIIIEEAAGAYDAGRPACDLDLEDIFEKTKRIDKQFLDSLAIPSFAISVRYSDIADIRIRRIWRIARTVYALLEQWHDNAPFSHAVRRAYTATEFREITVEILHLYNLETRMLAGAIRSPFHKSIAAYLEALFQSMESVMNELSVLCSRILFGEKTVHA